MVLPVSIQDNHIREAKAAQLTSIVGAVQHYTEKEDNTVACSRKREKVL